MRSEEDWHTLISHHMVSTCEQLEALANSKSPTLDLLLYLDYFKNTHTDPIDHIFNMISTQGYRVPSITLLNTQIEVDAECKSQQVFIIQVRLLMLVMNREELVILKKSFKDIKRYIKSVKRDLDACRSFSVLSSIEIPDAKREEDLYH